MGVRVGGLFGLLLHPAGVAVLTNIAAQWVWVGVRLQNGARRPSSSPTWRWQVSKRCSRGGQRRGGQGRMTAGTVTVQGGAAADV